MARVRRWILLFSAVLALGCSGIEGQCETACDAAERCDIWAPESGCVDYCIENYESAGEACQEEFDELTDCLDENESCDDVYDECTGEYANARDECDWLSPPPTIGPA